jgi:3-methyladenine DNA glycosylase AlkC
MAEPFKNLINNELITQTGAHLKRVWPAFDQKRFVREASHGLDALEMKARAMQIASALEATLPEDFERAVGLLEAAMAPPFNEHNATGEFELAPMKIGPQGLAGWVVWSTGEFVVRRGMQAPERALQALHHFTQRFTTEYAIRPFIAQHPELVFKTLQRWLADPSMHVRRLVSEGSRPRLPWGLQLKALVADPSPTLPLLRVLQDDRSEYVRRSVANHLNDIAKDHPTLVARWLEEHLPGASKERQALLKHASRTLVKAGDARVLKAWGVGKALHGSASLTLDKKRVCVGETLGMTVQLQSSSRTAQKIVLDYVVHHVKADGSTRPKVFKGWNLTLPPGQALELNKQHSLKEITTRRYHAGQHRIELMANGAAVAEAPFVLKL